MFFASNSIPDQYKTQEICDVAVSLYPLFDRILNIFN